MLTLNGQRIDVRVMKKAKLHNRYLLDDGLWKVSSFKQASLVFVSTITKSHRPGKSCFAELSNL